MAKRKPPRASGRGMKRVAGLFGAALLAAAVTHAGAQVQPRAGKHAQNLLPPQLVTASPATLAAQRILAARVDALGQGFDGDVGIAVKDVQSGWTTDFDGKTHFPQQSVSKFWVSLTALDKVDRGELDLGKQVTLGRDDLTLFNQPIAQMIRKGSYTTTLADLMNRALQQSDNTANDVLLRNAGGPEAVRSFLLKKGIAGIRFGPGERIMQSEIAGLTWQPSYSVGNGFYTARNLVPLQLRRAAIERYIANPIDGATPLGTVEALSRLKEGELLSPQSTQRILTIMSNTKTGPQRLKGGLAPGWRLAHKTGTGQVLGGIQAGYNDIGILTAPDGRSFAVAVLIRRTSTPLGTRMQLMQNVTRAVIDYVDNQRDGMSQATGG
jgi:beta-lactamase class A